MNSPTQRSLAFLRKEGYTAQVVEHWNAFAKRRVDLFGCIDILALKSGIILGVQATSGTNASARLKKALRELKLAIWLEAGGYFEVWSWAKQGRSGEKKTWKLRRQVVSMDGSGLYTFEVPA